MIVLGIESSCDETAAAVVRNGHDVLSNVISSQMALHAGYGGVIPELAAREHLRNISPVVQEALAAAQLTIADISAIAVTSRPGLIPALLVGNAYAKGLAAAQNIPLIGINHFLAHIYGSFLGQPEILADRSSYPILALVVSGGHTAIVLIEADGNARILGSTLDDAAGEALDKAAKILGLGYPGGPVIDRIAKTGNPQAYAFPRGLTGAGGKAVKPEHRYDFSFSGVKTALLYAVKDKTLDEAGLADAVASYQEAVMEVLVSKAMTAASDFATPLICCCGGVACNSRLRALMTKETARLGRRLLAAPPKYCTDNAAMVAGLGWHYLRKGMVDDLAMGVEARLDHSLGTLPFAAG
ncbi:MAG: tRNA (adenosine(37)-N6)-threonylcarbamoyltransferase complex transferase subunit TsaD [Lentisphaerae bacterium]|jgi:N6-L-threonylcarbamoyladenine synthase|nr:tRNA (adenosine(37)-N6)-threonylcarbamoyltransferase complex transferase subunit TsaD [Lentisphaerota bacterium]